MTWTTWEFGNLILSENQRCLPPYLAFRRAAPKAVKHAKTSLGSRDPSFTLQHAKFWTSRKRPGNFALDGVWTTLYKSWFNQGWTLIKILKTCNSKNTIATFLCTSPCLNHLFRILLCHFLPPSVAATRYSKTSWTMASSPSASKGWCLVTLHLVHLVRVH